MEKWKVPKGYSFMEYHDNDDCVVFYYQNNCNPEDVKAYLIPKEKKVTEPVKTYEEGFIAGFSHNIKTVEELEEQIKVLKSNLNENTTRILKAIEFLKVSCDHEYYYKYNGKYLKSEIKEQTLEILKGNEK